MEAQVNKLQDIKHQLEMSIEYVNLKMNQGGHSYEILLDYIDTIREIMNEIDVENDNKTKAQENDPIDELQSINDDFYEVCSFAYRKWAEGEENADKVLADLFDETARIHRELNETIEEVDFQMNRECAEKEELKDELEWATKEKEELKDDLEWATKEIEDCHHEIMCMTRELQELA